MRSAVTLFVGLAFMLAAAAPAWCWGDEGHRAVAMVAEGLLAKNSKAAKAIRSLAGKFQLRDLAPCADQVRTKERQPTFVMSPPCQQVFANPVPGTTNWHFVNLDVNAPDPSDAMIDQICHNDCAVSQVLTFLKTLGNRSASKADRAQALAFVVHFMGDLHQPLHAAERNQDEGGYTVVVDFLPASSGSKGPSSGQQTLHSVWDSSILGVIAADENVFVPMIQPQVAQARQETVPAQLDTWVHSWARESLGLARTVAYAGVNPPPTPQLGPAYVQAADPVVRQQIARAGFRLAMVLSRTLQ